MMRVLIVDDQKLVRQGLHIILSRAQGVQVVGEARDGQEAVDLTRDLSPDVVLMDVRMPRLNGLLAAQQIAALDSPALVLMVAMQCDEETVRQALQNGAKGFVAKSEMYSELIPALQALGEGRCYYSASIVKMLPALGIAPAESGPRE
jgi:DNA-binding NarL/FixJ family response regulator